MLQSTKALVLTFSLVFPIVASAHPGNTDAYGCHTCKTNCTEKWNLQYGEYHCHTPKSGNVVTPKFSSSKAKSSQASSKSSKSSKKSSAKSLKKSSKSSPSSVR